MDDRHAGTGQPAVADTVRGAGGRGGPETVPAHDRPAVRNQLADGVEQQDGRRAVLGAVAAGRVHRHSHHGGAHIHRRDSRRRYTRRAQHVLQRHAQRRHTVRVLHRATGIVRRPHILFHAGSVCVPGGVHVDTRVTVLLCHQGQRQEGARSAGVAAGRPRCRGTGRGLARADAHQGRGEERAAEQGLDARPVRVRVQPESIRHRPDRGRGRRAVRHDHGAGVRVIHVRARRHERDAVARPVHHAAGRADILHDVRHRFLGGQARPPAAVAVLVFRVRRVRTGHRRVLLQTVGQRRIAGRLDPVHCHRVVRRHLQHRAGPAVAYAPGRNVPVQRPGASQRHHVRHVDRHIVHRAQDVPGDHGQLGHTRQLFHLRYRVPGVVRAHPSFSAGDQGQNVRADPKRDHENHRRSPDAP